MADFMFVRDAAKLWNISERQVSSLAIAYNQPKLKELASKKKFRVPDAIPNPKEELYKLIPEHQQIAGAKLVAPHMDIESNTSISFNHFVSGVRRLANQ